MDEASYPRHVLVHQNKKLITIKCEDIIWQVWQVYDVTMENGEIVSVSRGCMDVIKKISL